jgi:hypothetical protein
MVFKAYTSAVPFECRLDFCGRNSLTAPDMMQKRLQGMCRLTTPSRGLRLSRRRASSSLYAAPLTHVGHRGLGSFQTGRPGTGRPRQSRQ